MDYDKEKYKEWKLPNLMLVHWILNPGLVINELLLGQRVPKVTLVDKTSTAPLIERQYVPCPHCNAINDARLWSKGNALGHWLGMVCPKCGGVIPCLWNVFSLLILALTFPIWMPIKFMFEKRWIEYERKRIQSMSISALPKPTRKSWVKIGAFWATFMFIFMSLPKIIKEDYSVQQIAIQVVVWIIAGAIFSSLLWFFMGRKK